jgi:UDP:flavonoid glycosyltransferase YjiC (YdhE family)
MTVQPGLGHLHPTIPVARALSEAGHDVRVASAASFGPTIERCGLASLRAGVDWLESEADATFPGFTEMDGAGQLRSFLEASDRFSADLQAVLHDDRPDLVVRDVMEFGGWFAAEHLKIPHVALGLTGVVPRELLSFLVPGAVPAAVERNGLPPDDDLERVYGFGYASVAPDILQTELFPTPSNFLQLAPMIFDRSGREELPDSITQRDTRRPLVYLTFGTVLPGPRCGAVLDAIQVEDVDIVVTVGREHDPAELGERPPNVIVERYIPQTALLEHCTAVMCHAGAGTVAAAVMHGLPMVVIPMNADQPLNARMCVEQGLATSLGNLDPSGLGFPRTDLTRLRPDDVRAALRSVLDDPSFAVRARAAATRQRTHPTPADAVPLLERVVATGEPLGRPPDQG